MNTLDRIIRIIYKEIPLRKLINNSNPLSHVRGESKNCTCYFDFLNEPFKNLFKRKYSQIYPNNYNENELDYFIEGFSNTLRYKYNADHSNCFNTIKLLLYVSENLLFMNSAEIKVHFNDLLELNGFVNKIDNNILMAAKIALEQRNVQSNDKLRANHDNNRLLRILENGVSENHMHLKGSGYTTDMNWYEFSNRRESELIELENVLKTIDGIDFMDETVALYKVRFIKFYLFSKLQASKGKPLNYNQNTKSFLDCIDSLLDYQSIEDYNVYFAKNRHLLYNLQEEFNMEYRNNMISVKKYYLIERSFLSELFSMYLKNKMDSTTLYLFNIYLLATSKFKLLFNQDNIGMGFEKFKYSENIKELLLKDYSNTEIYKTVFDKYYSERNIKKIEFRVTPKNSITEYINLIDQLERANKEIYQHYKNKNIDKIKFGLILHYIKNKDEFDLRDGCSRKEKTYNDYNIKCDALISFFNGYDKIKAKLPNYQDNYRNKIVGIDTANYEFNCRPEIFGYIYRRQRKEIYASHKLKFTYHVGEDFTCIADGIRAIDEVIEFLNFSRGDRLGHALALGLDLNKYFSAKRNKIVQNLESYLDDLVWMRFLIAQENLDKAEIEELHCENSIYEIIKYLEDEFYKLFSAYHLDCYTIYDYYSSYRLRGDYPFIYDEINEAYEHALKTDYNEDSFYEQMTLKYGEKLNSLSSDYKKHFLNPKARDLFFRYHFSKDYKEKHHSIINTEADTKYMDAVKISQFLLRKKVYTMQIGIESNPTSNRKISFINKYIDLPFIKFNKKYIVKDSKYNLSTSINTDDSAIFQTDLSLEYAYVVATLEREGFDVEDIYEYINYIRETSMYQSFVLEDNYENKDYREKTVQNFVD